MFPHLGDGGFVVDNFGWFILEVIFHPVILLIIEGVNHSTQIFLTKCTTKH